MTLVLIFNGIDAEGARHIANALIHNKVRQILYSSINYLPILFNAGVNNVKSWAQQDSSRRNSIYS
jgi:hypothetical protein